MTINTLYNTILSARWYNWKKNFRIQSIKNNVNSHNIPYFLFELKTSPIKVERYELINHHISVYAEMPPSSIRSCQYHYTATLKDKYEHTYHAHLYYDDENKLVGRIHLVKNSFHRPRQKIECLYPEQFKALASSFIYNWVAQARSLQYQLVTDDIAEYNSLMKKCLDSSRLATNKAKLKDIIQNKISVLERILKHTQNTTRFTDKKIFLENLLRSMSMTEGDVKTYPSSLTQKLKPSLTVFIEQLNQQLRQFSLEDDMKMAIKIICEIYFKFTNLELRIIDLYNPSIQEQIYFEGILSKIETLALTILKSCLLQNQIGKVEQLSRFMYLIPQDFIYSCLDDKSLYRSACYLLSNKMLFLTFSQWILQGSNCHSLIDYCIQNRSKQHAIALLTIILARDMHALLHLSQEGIPYAALYFITPQDPRILFIKSVIPDMKTNLEFYMQLKQLLVIYVAQGVVFSIHYHQLRKLIQAIDTTLSTATKDRNLKLEQVVRDNLDWLNKKQGCAGKKPLVASPKINRCRLFSPQKTSVPNDLPRNPCFKMGKQ